MYQPKDYGVVSKGIQKRVCPKCKHDTHEVGAIKCEACGQSLLSEVTDKVKSRNLRVVEKKPRSQVKGKKKANNNKKITIFTMSLVCLAAAAGVGVSRLSIQTQIEGTEFLGEQLPKPELRGIMRYWSPPCNENLMSNLVDRALSNNGRFKIVRTDIGTSDPIGQLKRKNIQLAILEKAPFLSQEKKAKELGYKLASLPISLDGVTYLVNKEATGVKTLSVSQIEKIYRGEITNWKQVGGNDLIINPILLSGMGRNSLTIEFKNKLNPNTVFVENRKVAIDELHKHKGGLFYTSATLAIEEKGVDIIALENEDKEIVSPVIEIDGKKQPNRKAFVSGRYPHLRTLMAVYLDNEQMPKRVAKFITSSEGQRLVKKLGFVPLYIGM